MLIRPRFADEPDRWRQAARIESVLTGTTSTSDRINCVLEPSPTGRLQRARSVLHFLNVGRGAAAVAVIGALFLAYEVYSP